MSMFCHFKQQKQPYFGHWPALSWCSQALMGHITIMLYVSIFQSKQQCNIGILTSSMCSAVMMNGGCYNLWNPLSVSNLGLCLWRLLVCVCQCVCMSVCVWGDLENRMDLAKEGIWGERMIMVSSSHLHFKCHYVSWEFWFLNWFDLHNVSSFCPLLILI